MRTNESTPVLVEIKGSAIQNPRLLTVLMTNVLQNFVEVKGLLGVFKGEVGPDMLRLIEAHDHLRVLKV